MAKLELDTLLRFQEMLHSFAQVERIARIKGRDLRENDVEHSFIMAMLAWYAIEAFDLPLNKDKVLRYALVHDLVEVYAGDTYIWDEEAKKTKHEREEKARVRLQKEFPEFAGLHDTIKEYEKQADDESRFVKALDKVQPVMTNYAENGRAWKEMVVSFTELVANKREKTSFHSELSELLEEIIARMEPRKLEYFPKE